MLYHTTLIIVFLIEIVYGIVIDVQVIIWYDTVAVARALLGKWPEAET